MPRIALAKLEPTSNRPVGQEMAEAHSYEMGLLLAAAPVGDQLAIFDFAEIQDADHDYLHRFLTPFFHSPELVNEPIDGFLPVLTNVSSKKLDRALETYALRRKRVLVVADCRSDEPQFQRLIGHLEGPAASAYAELLRLGQLSGRTFTDLPLWRELEVHLAHLAVSRVAIGRFENGAWIYRPTVAARPSSPPE